MVHLAATHDLETFRAAVRPLLVAGVAPERVSSGDGPGLFDAIEEAAVSSTSTRSPPRVPPRFFDLAADVLLHRSPDRVALLYRLAWRLTRPGGGGLLDDAADVDVHAAGRMAAAVRRDVHQMRAFVRFREVKDERGVAHVAWYRPDHAIERRNADFFRARFAALRWAIVTPARTIAWDGETLRDGPGAPRHTVPSDDELDELWLTYYAAIFNPARVNLVAMRGHMPRRRWPGLPELAALPGLVASAGEREVAMRSHGAERDARLPARRDLATLRATAASCTACPLHATATGTVFGTGASDAAIVLVGEQPGDEEDLAGAPFIGPAGRVLDRALVAAGIERRTLYLTNAVKHFHHEVSGGDAGVVRERGGKARVHKRPLPQHVRACRPWLLAELAAIAPRRVVCLGATAAHAVLGSRVPVERSRGRTFALDGGAAVRVTYHPSAVLRAEDRERADAIFAMLAADLRAAG